MCAEVGAEKTHFKKTRIMKKTHVLSVAALLTGSLAAAHAQTIADWTFQSDAIAVNNNPAADIGSGTASSIGMNIYPTPNVGVTTDDVLVGKNSDTGVNALANLTQTWRIRGQAGANGAANGWSSLAPIGTQGAIFAASTVGFSGSAINISFDWYSTTQGDANLELLYTDNGTTWNNLQINIGANASEGLTSLYNSTSANTVNGYYISDNLLNNGSLAGQDWFQGLSASITDPGALNNPDFAIELVNASTGADDVSTQGTALNNNSGNWRFDNIGIVAVPVPEPGTLALAGLGGLMSLLTMRRFRKA
jgi:PEP-CTERM motif